MKKIMFFATIMLLVLIPKDVVALSCLDEEEYDISWFDEETYSTTTDYYITNEKQMCGLDYLNLEQGVTFSGKNIHHPCNLVITDGKWRTLNSNFAGRLFVYDRKCPIKLQCIDRLSYFTTGKTCNYYYYASNRYENNVDCKNVEYDLSYSLSVEKTGQGTTNLVSGAYRNVEFTANPSPNWYLVTVSPKNLSPGSQNPVKYSDGMFKLYINKPVIVSIIFKNKEQIINDYINLDYDNNKGNVSFDVLETNPIDNIITLKMNISPKQGYKARAVYINGSIYDLTSNDDKINILSTWKNDISVSFFSLDGDNRTVSARSSSISFSHVDKDTNNIVRSGTFKITNPSNNEIIENNITISNFSLNIDDYKKLLTNEQITELNSLVSLDDYINNELNGFDKKVESGSTTTSITHTITVPIAIELVENPKGYEAVNPKLYTNVVVSIVTTFLNNEPNEYVSSNVEYYLENYVFSYNGNYNCNSGSINNNECINSTITQVKQSPGQGNCIPKGRGLNIPTNGVVDSSLAKIAIDYCEEQYTSVIKYNRIDSDTSIHPLKHYKVIKSTDNNSYFYIIDNNKFFIESEDKDSGITTIIKVFNSEDKLINSLELGPYNVGYSKEHFYYYDDNSDLYVIDKNLNVIKVPEELKDYNFFIKDDIMFFNNQFDDLSFIRYSLKEQKILDENPIVIESDLSFDVINTYNEEEYAFMYDDNSNHYVCLFEDIDKIDKCKKIDYYVFDIVKVDDGYYFLEINDDNEVTATKLDKEFKTKNSKKIFKNTEEENITQVVSSNNKLVLSIMAKNQLDNRITILDSNLDIFDEYYYIESGENPVPLTSIGSFMSKMFIVSDTNNIYLQYDYASSDDHSIPVRLIVLQLLNDVENPFTFDQTIWLVILIIISMVTISVAIAYKNVRIRNEI